MARVFISHSGTEAALAEELHVRRVGRGRFDFAALQHRLRAGRARMSGLVAAAPAAYIIEAPDSNIHDLDGTAIGELAAGNCAGLLRDRVYLLPQRRR